MSKNNDLTLYSMSFDVAGLMAEVKSCVDVAFNTLSRHMHRIICDVIWQCSEASSVMKGEAQKNVKELSRVITNTNATIEVGIDEGQIGGGEQGYVRVMVSLHGNHSVWARVGGVAWTKNVGSKRKNHVQFEYHLPQFEQGDHSAVMVQAFEHDIDKYAKDCYNSIIAMINAIDWTKYLIIA